MGMTWWELRELIWDLMLIGVTLYGFLAVGTGMFCRALIKQAKERFPEYYSVGVAQRSLRFAMLCPLAFWNMILNGGERER